MGAVQTSLANADQAIVDRLFDCATLHIQTGIMLSRPWAFETMVMAVLLEQQKMVEQIQQRMEGSVANFAHGRGAPSPSSCYAANA
jgi:hypothetical protein